MSASPIPPAEVETVRLRLRRPRPSDAGDVYAYGSDAHVSRFLSWPTHRTLEDARLFLEHATRVWAQGTEFPYAIERVEDRRVIGGITLTPRPAGAWRVGYVLARAHWGNGYASEALQAVLDVAFHEVHAKEVEALVHPDNAGSVHVLEKAGFSRGSLAPRCGVLPQLGTAPPVWTYSLRAPAAASAGL